MLYQLVQLIANLIANIKTTINTKKSTNILSSCLVTNGLSSLRCRSCFGFILFLKHILITQKSEYMKNNYLTNVK